MGKFSKELISPVNSYGFILGKLCIVLFSQVLQGDPKNTQKTVVSCNLSQFILPHFFGDFFPMKIKVGEIVRLFAGLAMSCHFIPYYVMSWLVVLPPVLPVQQQPCLHRPPGSVSLWSQWNLENINTVRTVKVKGDSFFVYQTRCSRSCSTDSFVITSLIHFFILRGNIFKALSLPNCKM